VDEDTIGLILLSCSLATIGVGVVLIFGDTPCNANETWVAQDAGLRSPLVENAETTRAT